MRRRLPPPSRHEVVREQGQAGHQRCPLPPHWTEDQGVSSAPDLHFLPLELELLRDANGLAVAATEDLGRLHEFTPCIHVSIYGLLNEINGGRAVIHRRARSQGKHLSVVRWKFSFLSESRALDERASRHPWTGDSRRCAVLTRARG